MCALVSLVKSPDSEQGIKRSMSKALTLINFVPQTPLKSVIIKPNLCYYWQAATGYTTDPRIVAAVIDYIRETCGESVQIRVAEADATAMRTKHAFLMLGYEKLARQKGIELLNLSTEASETRTVTVGNHELKFAVPKSLLEANLVINIPKLKTMRDVLFTCAMKNMFGSIATPKKIQYHPVLNEAIVGINKILGPHLTIVDGLVASGRFPVRLGLIMGSADAFSVDWVAASIMGYDPSGIKFLKLAVKEKLGDPQGLKVVGEEAQTFKKLFPHQSALSLRSWTFQLRLLRLYARITGDVIPPMLE